jgi:hypothetical protein
MMIQITPPRVTGPAPGKPGPTIHALPSAGAEPTRQQDVCAYLFGVCRDLQRHYLDRLQAELLFDVAPGKLPEAACHVLGRLVGAFVRETVGDLRAMTLKSIVGIALRRRDTRCVAVLCDSGLRDYTPVPQAGFGSLETGVAQLGGVYTVRTDGSSRTITVAFATDAHPISGAWSGDRAVVSFSRAGARRVS